MDWQQSDGSSYPHDVLRPSKARILKAGYITDNGVEAVVLMEMSGVYEGHAYVMAVELSTDDAAKVSLALAEVLT